MLYDDVKYDFALFGLGVFEGYDHIKQIME